MSESTTFRGRLYTEYEYMRISKIDMIVHFVILFVLQDSVTVFLNKFWMNFYPRGVYILCNLLICWFDQQRELSWIIFTFF